MSEAFKDGDLVWYSTYYRVEPVIVTGEPYADPGFNDGRLVVRVRSPKQKPKEAFRQPPAAVGSLHRSEASALRVRIDTLRKEMARDQRELDRLLARLFAATT